MIHGIEDKLPAVEFEKAKTYIKNEEVVIEVVDFNFGINIKIEVNK